MARITLILSAVLGLLFAVLGTGFWVAPDLVAGRFAIQAADASGLSTLRADMGGFFLIVAGLIFTGLFARRRGLLIVAATLLGLAAAGRLFGLGLSGRPDGLAATLPVEIAGIVVLALRARFMAGDPRRTLLIAGSVSALGIALVVGLFAFVLRLPAVQDAVFVRVSGHNLVHDVGPLMKDDAMRVVLCGTSAPLPSRRAKACVAVIAEGQVWIVDTGPESTENLLLWGVPLDKIAGVLITHFHSDHIGDLGELNLQSWVQGRSEALRVYGGPGVERVVGGFDEAYALDRGYRTAHHSAALLPPAIGMMVALPVEMPASGPRVAVLHDDGALRITAIETNHAPVHPAYAYRFDFKGRSVVITGDTTAFAPLTAAARGADVLVSEAMNREMIRTLEVQARKLGRPRVAKIMSDIQTYHTSPVEAADMANRAGVKLLVLYHELPAADNAMARSLFTRGLDTARKGDWDLANDGSLYTLPVGSKAVKIGAMPR